MSGEIIRLGVRPVRGFGLGQTPQDIAQNGYNLYQQIPAPVQSEMVSWLGNQVPGGATQAQQYVQQFSQVGQGAFNVLQDLSAKNPGKAIGDATPLIAVGLAAAGASPLIGVAVIAGVGLLASIVGSLFPPPVAQQCDYAVGYTCFHVGARASGPNDPNWVTIEQFDVPTSTSNAGSISWENLQGFNSMGSSWAFQAFTWWEFVGMELYALGDRSIAATDWAAMVNWSIQNKQGFYTNYQSADDAAQKMYLTPNAYKLALLGDNGKAFLIAFDHAFIKMQEIPINGFQRLPTNLLVNAIVQGWNSGYDASKQYGFTPSSDIENSDGTSSSTFIQWVLAGGYDQQRICPGANCETIVNLGPKLGSIQLPPGGFTGLTAAGPPTGGSSSSSVGKVAVGALAVGAVGAGGLYAYAHYSGLSMLEAVRRLKFW